MEIIDSVWQVIIISLVAGVLIGALGYRLLSPSVKRIDDVESERDKAREEMANYKASVNQHFNKTSDLVNDLTQNYVKVYQHLADGAQSLGDIGTLTNLLESRQGKVSIAVSDEAKNGDSIAVVSPIETATTQEAEETVQKAGEPSSDMEIDDIEPKDFVDESATTDTSESIDEVINPTESNDPVVEDDSVEADSKSTVADSESTVTDTTAEQDNDSTDADTPEEKKTEDKKSSS